MQTILPCTESVHFSAKTPPGDAHGTCSKTSRGFVVRVNLEYPWEVICDWLLPHEYTHARVWGRLQSGTRDHDAHFGVELMIVEDEASNLASYDI